MCLACRTLLDDGEQCGARGHEAVSLREPAGRRRLLDEVWGPDSRARQLRQAAKAGAGGGAAGGLVNTCSGLDVGSSVLDGCSVVELGEGLVGALVAILVAVIAAVLVAAVFWLLKALVDAIRAWMDRPKPHGALLPPPKAPRERSGRGTVKPTTLVELPWTGGQAAAYALELRRKNVFGGGAILRDAASGGFDVAMPDGRVVRIPAGRLRIVGERARARVDEQRVDAFLRTVVTEHASDAGKPPFPYDDARVVVVAPDDEVEVLGELAAAADATGAHLYRGSAGVLVPVGVPVIRVRPKTRVVGEDPRVRIEEAAEAEEEEPASEEPTSAAPARRGASTR